MVAGTGARLLGILPWYRALLAWMFIILAESLHGIARAIFLAPVVGDLRARQWGVALGCVIILAIAVLTIRWLGVTRRAALLGVGAFWVVLTVLFEAALGRALGLGWDRILADYNPARGGFMILGLAFMLIAPLLAARLRNGRSD
jgi:hypothetical protein